MSDSKSDTSPNWFQRYGFLVYFLILIIGGVLLAAAFTFQKAFDPLLTSFFVNAAAVMAVTAFLFFIVNKVLGFDLEGERQRELDDIVKRLSEAADKATGIDVPKLVQQLAETERQLGQAAEKLKVFGECDLFRFCDQIQYVPPQEWYDRIQNANGDILLMSPFAFELVY